MRPSFLCQIGSNQIGSRKNSSDDNTQNENIERSDLGFTKMVEEPPLSSPVGSEGGDRISNDPSNTMGWFQSSQQKESSQYLQQPPPYTKVIDQNSLENRQVGPFPSYRELIVYTQGGSVPSEPVPSELTRSFIPGSDSNRRRSGFSPLDVKIVMAGLMVMMFGLIGLVIGYAKKKN